jgi:RimJ/RimL family protein N-acetyltransferase
VNYAAIFADGWQSQGYGAEASLLFIDHVFQSWPFRKVYATMAEFNYQKRDRTEAFVTHEATLKDYYYFDGRYWDQYVLSFTADAWRPHSVEERSDRHMSMGRYTNG